MGTAKVSTDFSQKNYSDTEISVTATNIVNDMTGNLYFEKPIPTLAEITATIASYNTALVTAEKGSKAERSIKSDWRAKLESQLRELSLYVQLTSKGDSLIIESSGFDINKKPTLIGELQKPENVIVKMGENNGTVWVSCDAIPSASFYEFAYAEVLADGTLNWVYKTCTKRKLLIEGLTSGKQYVFRIAGAGSNPSRIWSSKIATFVI